MFKLFFVLIISLIIPIHIFCQNIEFGKVSKNELAEKFYLLDSSANASILYKNQRTFFQYTRGVGWDLVTEIHERIKLYNENGYEWATKSIRLFNTTETKERVTNLKAITYNLEDNQISQTKIKKEEIFNEKSSANWSIKKFTLPNLQKSCIVEWSYRIVSPYHRSIDDLIIQYKIPIKKFEAKVEIPEYFIFKNQYQGHFLVGFKKSNRDGAIHYNGIPTYFKTNVISCSINNVPALVDEPYVDNIFNYRSALKFELTATKFPSSGTKKFNTTWDDVTKTIYKSSNFGKQLDKTSYFKKDLEKVINLSDPMNKKKLKIFQFIKNKIKWNNFKSTYTNDGVKKAYKDGVGNVAEINLTLVAMLREAGLNANPILVSTRDHGISLFPTSRGFNYVIAGIEMNNEIILLDATEEFSLPNVLPLRTINWQGRIVRKDGSSAAVNLFPTNLSSTKVLLNTKLDAQGMISGLSRTLYSNLIALNYRNKYNEVRPQELIGQLEKENQNIEIVELKVSNEKDISKVLTHTMSFKSDSQVEIIAGKLYFSPLLFLTEKENPFKLEERKYPIDFGSPWEKHYTVNIEIPKGYVLESKPENVAYALPNNSGLYKFICLAKGNKLQILSIAQLKKSIIPAMDYGTLKEFYKKMIDKQLEKVVLTKQ